MSAFTSMMFEAPTLGDVWREEKELRRRKGAAIRAARRRAGLTQTELAARVGANQPWLANVEAGRGISVKKLEEIAAALGEPLTRAES